MAISSIFTNIVIKDPKKVDLFAEALEVSSHYPKWKPSIPVKPLLTDVKSIKKLMTKCI